MADKSMKLSRAKVVAEAKHEVEQELLGKYKTEYKNKLRDKAAAEKVLANIERELEDLELKMEQEIGG